MMNSVHKKVLTWVLLLGVVLATSWSLFQPGFFRIHDFTQGARVVEMARGLQGGEFPVRWSQNFGYGYGMPLFEFYAPLPFYVGGGLYLIGVPLILTLKILWIIPTLLTVLGAYWLGEKVFGRAGGVVLATALTLAPYRAVNLFVRGALSEAWGMMALPWIILGWVKVGRGEVKGWWYIVLGLVTLFLSHNLMTMLFVPVSLLFGGGFLLVEWWQARGRERVMKKWLERVVVIGSGYVLAAGLAAFYLIPALAEKDLTSVSRIFTGYFNYANHFLYVRQFFNPKWGYGGSAWGPNDDISFFLGWGQLVGLVVLGLTMLKELWTAWRNRDAERKVNLSVVGLASVIGGCLGLSLFMSLERSAPIWSALSILAMVQFPWRWLGVATLFVAMAVAMGASRLKPAGLRYGYLAALWLIMMSTSYSYFKPEAFLTNTDEFYYPDDYRIRHEMSETLFDYVPVQMKLDEKGKLPVVDGVVGLANTASASTVVFENRPTVKEILIAQGPSPQAQTVLLAIADFPGWQIYLNNQPVEHTQAPLGNIMVQIPAQDQVFIKAVFRSSPVRFWSDMLSGVSWVIFLGLVAQNTLYPTLQKVLKKK